MKDQNASRVGTACARPHSHKNVERQASTAFWQGLRREIAGKNEGTLQASPRVFADFYGKVIMMLAMLLFALLGTVARPAHAQSGVTNSTKNPLLVAILHWQGANPTTSRAGAHRCRF